MQFKGKKSRNWKKLKSHARSKRCHICSYHLRKTAVYIWDIKTKDGHWEKTPIRADRPTKRYWEPLEKKE